MKKLLLLLLNFAILGAFAQNLQWARTIGSTASDHPDKIVLDASGNVYTIGFFSGTADFDPGPGVFNMTPTPSVGTNSYYPEVYISKLDANGNFLWAKQMGGPGDDRGNSLGFDASGNIYVLGSFRGTADFDPGPGVYNLTALGLVDNFICKLDPSGNFVWAQRIGGVSAIVTTGSMAVDAVGNIFLEGFIQNSITFGTSLVLNGNIGSSFVCKMDASGNFLWVKEVSSSNSTVTGNCIALSASGNIYTAGYFGGTADFDPGAGVFNLSTTGPSDGDIFISMLDGSGNFLWAKKIGGAGADNISSMTCDPSGDLCIAGLFAPSADFDPGPGVFNLTVIGNQDIFVSKLDASGNFIWAKSIGAASYADGEAATDGLGNVYITGTFAGTADFDPGTAVFNLTSIGFNDAFVSKLDPSGNFIWAGSFGGGNGSESGNSIAPDALGNVYITGQYGSSIVDFDPGQGTAFFPNLGSEDIFISKFGACLSPSVTVITATSQVCAGSSTTLSAMGNGVISWFGTPTSTPVLGTGTVFTTPVLTAGFYTFYAEAATCTTSAIRMGASLTVLALPQVTTSSQPAILCFGQTAVLNAGGSAIIYSWSGLGGGTSFVVSPASTTAYTISGTDANNCVNSSMITLTVVSCTGLNNNEPLDVSVNVFPNPTQDELQIQFASEMNGKSHIVSIYNHLGQLVFEEDLVFNGQNAEITTAQLPEGCYILKLHAGPGTSPGSSGTVSKRITILR